MNTDISLASTVDQAAFRDVVGHFASGVTVITTRHQEQRFGVTASAVSSRSFCPLDKVICPSMRTESLNS